MSSQKSTVPVHSKNSTKEGEHAHDRKISLNLDPYAAPDVYYGSSHNPRKVAKSRTYSAVSLPVQPGYGVQAAEARQPPVAASADGRTQD